MFSSEPGQNVQTARVGKGLASADTPNSKSVAASARRPPDTRQYVAASTGVGKSWLACALGHKAWRDDRSVSYQRVPRLFDALALARVDLLILDDWGLSTLTQDQGRDLLEIVDDRCDRGSLLITSQVPVSRWHEVIADPTLADAILDRIVHRAHRIELKGPSLRRRLVAAESTAA